CFADIFQNGTIYNIGTMNASGTVNTTTGVLNVSGSFGTYCPSVTATGTVSRECLGGDNYSAICADDSECPGGTCGNGELVIGTYDCPQQLIDDNAFSGNRQVPTPTPTSTPTDTPTPSESPTPTPTVAPTSTPGPVDHFTCYKAAATKGSVKFP